MKALTRKEPRQQLEFLLALEKLDRVLNEPRKAKKQPRGAEGSDSLDRSSFLPP